MVVSPQWQQNTLWEKEKEKQLKEGQEGIIAETQDILYNNMNT